METGFYEKNNNNNCSFGEQIVKEKNELENHEFRFFTSTAGIKHMKIRQRHSNIVEIIVI